MGILYPINIRWRGFSKFYALFAKLRASKVYFCIYFFFWIIKLLSLYCHRSNLFSVILPGSEVPSWNKIWSYCRCQQFFSNMINLFWQIPFHFGKNQRFMKTAKNAFFRQIQISVLRQTSSKPQNSDFWKMRKWKDFVFRIVIVWFPDVFLTSKKIFTWQLSVFSRGK